MSTWRLRGYVQDSDEDEEDVDTLYTNSSERDEERVVAAPSNPISLHDVAESPKPNTTATKATEDTRDISAESSLPAQAIVSPRPSTPRITSTAESQRSLTESPDPLQFSPAPTVIIHKSPPATSQILGEPCPLRFELLQNSSQSDDELADVPPTDEPAPSNPTVVFTSPTRHAEVQVVIPQSTAIEREHTVQRANRELRARKPIQLHPYVIEGERYRREFQSRGIKPVPKIRSPPRKPSHNDTETQEREFDPDNDSPANSPPDVFVSTPVTRRPRTNSLHGNSAGRPVSTSRRCSFLSTQPSKRHLPPSTKRRKLNRPSDQDPVFARLAARHGDGSTNGVSTSDDIWDLPHSPPPSSSPLIEGQGSALRRLSRLSVTTPVPNLPTPSNSSSVQGELQPLVNSDSESDVETDPRPVEQPVEQSARPRVTSGDKQSSPSTPSDSESAQSEVEVQRVGKKIKGVLPASWLRLDRNEQKKKKKAREHANAALSPEKAEPQRGVAQRIFNRSKSVRGPLPANRRPQDFVVISDGSDNESRTTSHDHENDTEVTHQSAAELAAILDQRYAGDSDDMEDDKLDLFDGGEDTRKRKRQLKLTDAFAKPNKKAKAPGKGSEAVVASKKIRTHADGHRRHGGPRRSTPAAPTLSILDLDASPSDHNRSVPQFIKLAKRQARRAPNHGRQSPTNKYVRLHTTRDTEDASLTLHQWRKGALKPNAGLGQPKRKPDAREPLADRNTNQQRNQPPPSTDKYTEPDQSHSIRSKSRPASAQRRRIVPEGLLAFHRRPDIPTQAVRPPTQLSSRKTKVLRPANRKSVSLRAAQLEGLETDYGRNDREAAFQRGLQQFDQQFGLDQFQPSRNIQIAKFLADDGTPLPPLPYAKDIGEQEEAPPGKKVSPQKRRLVRKHQARRIDVEAREYRQPSEPTIQDIFHQVVDVATPPESKESILLGLGSCSTRYSTAFDVSPLAVGTYFHSDTFIGRDELLQALQSSVEGGRDLEVFAGHHQICHNSIKVQCGTWNDETFAQIEAVLDRLWTPLDSQTLSEDDMRAMTSTRIPDSSAILRSLIKYFATRLSFLNTIDRQGFTLKMKQLLETLFNRVLQIHLTQSSEHFSAPSNGHQTVRAMTYLLVAVLQVRQIAHGPVAEAARSRLANLITMIAKVLVPYLIRKGVPELGSFLEKNKGYAERENGIQDAEILVESVVVCMHVLTTTNVTGPTFWDLVSHELSSGIESASHLMTFESVWASAFTLLPFIEFDASGILVSKRRKSFKDGNWTFIKDLLKRVFELYPGTFRTHGSSLNEYIRANLTRCHVLMHSWHWRRCELMLNAVFDFFGSLGLKQLRREESKGSPYFLEHLADQPSLNLDPSDNAFHIFLKCVALGIGCMKDVYTEKQIRSKVLRITPNNGRSYPKDSPLEQDALTALRNHHDLFCTLYWASPPSCRPKLDNIRSLVQHETSHREACRLNVRAWANLTAFQLSSDEPYELLQPFASWHKEIIDKTRKQYRQARTEAEDYFNAVKSSGTSNISELMVRRTIEKNQEQAIATLRDCVSGLRKAIERSSKLEIVRSFLIDSGVIDVLELVHIDDRRLALVIQDTLAVIKEYVALYKRQAAKEDSQPTSEESQDYGDFPDLDDIEEKGQQLAQQSSFTFAQPPLWHLLSNAFGAESEHAPDENLLMECVDTWALLAGCQVSSGVCSWSDYIDTFSKVSWKQLRHTEQTRKFQPYFMASLITCDFAAYEENRHEFLTALLLCLVDRESLLRFQHRLLGTIIQADTCHPLLQNLPFFRDEATGKLDITYDTLRTRRLAVISCMLANMREDFHRTIVENPGQMTETRQVYASMLKDFMNTMKYNYQQLQQGSAAAGTYVEFVQNIVQFLKQYTPDITPVLPFFTDSVAFPLPAADPTYVVGRLRGYAPKLGCPGVAKQLSMFLQTVAQQAASDHQQLYLVNQLYTAMCDADTPSADASCLRSVLLQGIVPAYIEAAFSTVLGMVIAKPILQSLKPMLEATFFDLRGNDEKNVRAILYSLVSISYAFIRGTKSLQDSPDLLHQPHILHTLTVMLEAITTLLPMLEYIQTHNSPSSSTNKPAFVTYIEEFTVLVTEVLHKKLPHTIPISPFTSPPPNPHADLLSSSARELSSSMKTNWTESHGRILFGQGYARREVGVDLGTFDEEKASVVVAIEAFHEQLGYLYGYEETRDRRGREDVCV